MKHGFRSKDATPVQVRFQKTWENMVTRCTSKSHLCYSKYGGRGIKVEWETFDEFINDMFPSFIRHYKKHGSRNTTIDRIDNDGNYSKANCRWATLSTQQHNQNKRKGLTSKYRGVSFSQGKWITAISKDGIKLHLGTFDTEVMAAKAYDKATKKLFGKLVPLNFPMEQDLKK